MRDQIDYLKRHHQTVIKHLTPKKVANLLLNDLEMRRKAVVLRSRPPFLKVEPTAQCSLHCPGCLWHKEGVTPPLTSAADLTYESFVNLIDPIKSTTVMISFSFRGDPFLSRGIFDMVRYCRDNNIGTDIPTHFSYRYGDDVLEKIIDSGLDHLIVAVDGSTQDVYAQYRKGGHLDWVLDNSRRLIELKRKKRSKTPLIEAKFIRFQHNKQQFEEVRLLSESMGFDRFSSVLDHHDPERKAVWAEVKRKARKKKNACYWVYRTAVICCDGQVCPCCLDNMNMGNALEDGLIDVWNGDRYRAMREMFSTGKPGDSNSAKCVGCAHFWASPSTPNSRATQT